MESAPKVILSIYTVITTFLRLWQQRLKTLLDKPQNKIDCIIEKMKSYDLTLEDDMENFIFLLINNDFNYFLNNLFLLAAKEKEDYLIKIINVLDNLLSVNLEEFYKRMVLYQQSTFNDSKKLFRSPFTNLLCILFIVFKDRKNLIALNNINVLLKNLNKIPSNQRPSEMLRDFAIIYGFPWFCTQERLNEYFKTLTQNQMLGVAQKKSQEYIKIANDVLKNSQDIEINKTLIRERLGGDELDEIFYKLPLSLKDYPNKNLYLTPGYLLDIIIYNLSNLLTKELLTKERRKSTDVEQKFKELLYDLKQVIERDFFHILYKRYFFSQGYKARILSYIEEVQAEKDKLVKGQIVKDSKAQSQVVKAKKKVVINENKNEVFEEALNTLSNINMESQESKANKYEKTSDFADDETQASEMGEESQGEGEAPGDSASEYQQLPGKPQEKPSRFAWLKNNWPYFAITLIFSAIVSGVYSYYNGKST